MKKEFTINEIAQEADVSKATVSRVLNNPSSVKEETRERVLKVIKKRHFSPSASARSLSKQTSNTIGVIVPEVDNPFFGEMLRGMTEIADEFQYTVICCNTDDIAEKDYRAIKMLREQRVLGLLYTPAANNFSKQNEKRINKALEDLNAPIVLVDRNVEKMEYDGVFFDDEEAVYEAVRELIIAGHTDIAIINASLDKVLGKIRFNGYKKALDEAQIPINYDYVIDADYKMIKSYEMTKALLMMEQPPTAVFTCNNVTSLGFLKGLYELGKENEVACIGLDGIEALEVVNANFNYVERNAKQMGKIALRLLYERIEDPEKPLTKVMLKPGLNIKKLQNINVKEREDGE